MPGLATPEDFKHGMRQLAAGVNVITVANAGGFDDWLSAKLPIRAPADPAGNE